MIMLNDNIIIEL